MPFDRTTRTIPTDAPGSETALTILRIGPKDAETKVYIQAALHADEQPGIMAIHHLLPLLEKADAEGRLNARFSIVPMANPLGMGQIHFQVHGGRYDDRTGTNFNRKWPDLFAAVGEKIAPRLTGSLQDNLKLIRETVRTWLDEQRPATAMQKVRHAIMLEAYDADYVLDLHCDNEALVHLFVTPDSMDHLHELADHVGSVAQLTAEDSGGGSFDEVWPSLWTRLRAAHPDKPIPFSGVAATVEYRGQHDVFDSIGKTDAENLMGFFLAKGFVDGAVTSPEPAPPPTSLSATQMLRIEKGGLLAYRVALGDWVEKGQPIADLIALDGPGAFVERTEIVAGTAGRVISRLMSKYVFPGSSIAKIVGTEPLAERAGYLLED